MTEADRLERDLATWLDDTAVPSVPDYVGDIVRDATRHRQRPRWTFVGRWLPAPIATLDLRRPPIRWGALVALVTLALLLAAIAAFVGSRQQVPPPFGLASNGLVTFTRGGDILTFDPSSGIEAPLLPGPETDIDPTWSLDGTRVAFIRQTANGDVMGFVDRDGGRPVFSSESWHPIDMDSVAWSPDGRGVGFAGGPDGAQDFYFVDAFTGRASRLPLTNPVLDPVWRPPDGRELMYLSDGPEPGLWLYSLDDDSQKKIVAQSGEDLRPRGWSPDGKRFVYTTTTETDPWFTTDIVDVASGEKVHFDAGPGRLSNDGTRVVAYRLINEAFFLCVADAAGGPCFTFGGPRAEPDPTHGDALNWSPDDQWVITDPGRAGSEVVLVDPAGIKDDVVLAADGAGSWQRRAP